MIDSHSHLDRCEGEPDELVERAREAGVARILTVGLDGAGNLRQVGLAERFPEVFAAVGRHPNEAEGFEEADAEALAELAGDDQVVAIGETGLDFYRDTASPDAQRRAFSAQIEVALAAGLPLVVHLRDREGSEEAVSEAFGTLERDGGELEVVLHCFSAPNRVEQAAANGWYCSFAGNVTYPANGALREAAAAVPDELLLVETDAPYLTPQSRRRERNESAFVVETADCVAEVRGVSPEDLDRTVTATAARLFGGCGSARTSCGTRTCSMRSAGTPG
ncbi:MAG: TatD family hydrolase [Solirubrobacterales bacterium]